MEATGIGTPLSSDLLAGGRAALTAVSLLNVSVPVAYLWVRASIVLVF